MALPALALVCGRTDDRTYRPGPPDPRQQNLRDFFLAPAHLRGMCAGRDSLFLLQLEEGDLEPALCLGSGDRGICRGQFFGKSGRDRHLGSDPGRLGRIGSDRLQGADAFGHLHLGQSLEWQRPSLFCRGGIYGGIWYPIRRRVYLWALDHGAEQPAVAFFGGDGVLYARGLSDDPGPDGAFDEVGRILKMTERMKLTENRAQEEFLVDENCEAPNLQAKEEKGAALLKYLILGILFGIVFVKAEIVSWFRIQEMFRLQSFHMYGVIGSAVVTGIISVWLIKKTKAKTLSGEPIVIHDKVFKKGQVIGGFIFGLGWAITGACPGPLFAQIGAGYSVVLVTLISALAGTWVYGRFADKLPN